MPQPLLHHHTVGDDAARRWLYVLHGIYGAGRNWASFARRFVEERPEWATVLVDLRLHGRSQGFEGPHTLAACVQDVRRLAEAIERPPAAVLGHSFGGKLALMSASVFSPSQVWVIDSTPSRRTPGGSAVRMLQVLRRLPGPFAERGVAVSALEAEGFALHVAHWMATNLVASDEGLRWRFEADDIEALLADFFRRDLWDVIETPAPPSEIHLVRAAESDVVSPAEMSRVDDAGGSGRVYGHELRGGHWLHVDNLDGLLALLGEHLA